MKACRLLLVPLFLRNLATILLILCGLAPLARAGDLPAGLVGYWTFEEGSGTTTADLSGHNFNGTFDNVATWGGPAWTNSPLGRYALSFDGVNDRVTIGNPPELQLTGPMTLSAWVVVRQFNPNNGRIITKGGGSGSRGWALNVEGGTTPPNTGSFQIGGTPTASFSVRTVDSIPSNVWIHLTGVYVPVVSMRIYTNGYLNNEVTASVPASQNNPNLNVTIGARPTGAPDTPWNGLIDEVRVFNRALTEEEIRALPELVQTPLTFVTQPVGRVVAQLRPVTFRAAVTGSLPHFYQWWSNGVAIPDAVDTTYTIPSVTLDMSGSAFSVTVSNLAHSVTSSNAILTVVADTNAPVLLSLGSADGRLIGLCFDEALDPLTATDSFNYSVNDGSVSVESVALRPAGKSVVLVLAGGGAPITGTFTVTVSAVTDLAGNPVPPNTTGTAQVAGFTAVDLNAPLQSGRSFSCTNGVFELTAGGSDFTGTADQGHVALKGVVGDFDVQVRVMNLTPASSVAKAGIMVRQSLEANSPTLHLLVNLAGQILIGRRTTNGGATAFWGPTINNAVLPNVWLRLRRAGDVFQGFLNQDGTNWVLIAQAAQAFTEPVLVGLAATAGNNSAPATLAEFREFDNVVFSGATLNITQAPANTSAEVNSVVTFTAAAEGIGAPANELIYQWQRGDGVGGFTNIFGANSNVLSFQVRLADQGAQFRVRVSFAGLVRDSAVATLTATPDVTPPTLVSARAVGNSSQVTVVFNETVSAATAESAINYTLTNELGVAHQVITATLGPDGRTVTLAVEPLAEGMAYVLVVSGVQDTAEPPNSIVANSTISFELSTLIGYWPLDEGAGFTTADLSGNNFTGTLLNGPVWVVPGLFGNGALEFDGVNDRVDVGNPTLLQLTGPMTLAAWVWVDTISGNGRIVTKGGASGQRGWSLNVENYDAWAFQIASSGTANITVSVTNVILGQWVHLAGVYDPTVPIMRSYTNGVLGGERTDGVPTSQYNSSLNVSMGARANNQTWFDGKIDEVRIYNRALSGAEVAALATPPIPRPRFGPMTIADGQLHLNWTGTGRLEWAPAVTGPWTAITPPPDPPYSEPFQPAVNRFFRLNSTP